MEFSEDNLSLEDYDNYQTTVLETNADSIKEIPIKANYKKWINSQSEISHISNIINLEKEASLEKNYSFIENYQEEKNKNETENKTPEVKKEELKENNNTYTFIYPGEGKNVKLTGSFCKWEIQYDMQKDSNDNKFKFAIPLKNEIYQFKFIVDGQWKYSSNYPTQKDNLGNINNVIDLTDYFKKNKTSEENVKEKLPNIENEPQKSVPKPEPQTQEPNKIIRRKESIYDCEFPSDDKLIPSPLPNKRYYKFFKLDKYSRQNSIGKEKFYDFNENYSFSNEASSKPIFSLGHINLNHLISFKNQKKISKNCMSFRYREKACTILYYK